MNELIWYVARASGITALVLFTATVVLGALTAGRRAPWLVPSAVRTAVHRTLSGVATAFLALHVVTIVADGYVDIGWWAALVPFSSAYDPFWVGLGTVAFDLLLAVVITSLLRDRIGHRLWRVVHLAAYAMWPIALVHGIGTSTSDGGLMLAVTGVCGLLGCAAIAVRVLSANPDRDRRVAVAEAWSRS